MIFALAKSLLIDPSNSLSLFLLKSEATIRTASILFFITGKLILINSLNFLFNLLRTAAFLEIFREIKNANRELLKLFSLVFKIKKSALCVKPYFKTPLISSLFFRRYFFGSIL